MKPLCGIKGCQLMNNSEEVSLILSARDGRGMEINSAIRLFKEIYSKWPRIGIDAKNQIKTSIELVIYVYYSELQISWGRWIASCGKYARYPGDRDFNKKRINELTEGINEMELLLKKPARGR